MPFTLAHPAAVLPLMRRPLDGLALVCGAMAPDIPYYIRSTPLRVTAQSWYEPFTNATTSHSAGGLLPVTLPLALVVYLMLLAAAPPAAWVARGQWNVDAMRTGAVLGEPADRLATRRTARWSWVLVSMLIGVLTHLVWDSLTSTDGFLAERLDALHETALADLTWVRVMQHVSTLLGLVAVVVAVWCRRRTLVHHDAASRRRGLWALAVLLAVGVGAGVAAVLGTVDSSASPNTRDFLENVLATGTTGGGAAIGLAVVMVTACWWLAIFGMKDKRPASGESGNVR